MTFNVVIIYFLYYCFTCIGKTMLDEHRFIKKTQDQTSPRANTLADDADDIQKQLDNESRDRIRFSKPKTIWVFHLPKQFPGVSYKDYDYRFTAGLNEEITKRDLSTLLNLSSTWNYKDQHQWFNKYPLCGGRSQSPVDLPYRGLVHAWGARKLRFRNYDVKPLSLVLKHDGERVVLNGKWKTGQRPFIFGGAAHGRRYIFHSLTLHWPAEHTISGLIHPFEAQAMHISAEYATYQDALKASESDPQAFLIISTVYRLGNRTQKGIADLMQAQRRITSSQVDMELNPLKHFVPPFAEYATYQGSLTFPPCEESVLWIIRGRSISITREFAGCIKSAENYHEKKCRYTNPLNDRKVYYFRHKT